MRPDLTGFSTARRTWRLVIVAALASACAAAVATPAAPQAPVRAAATLDQRVAWLLRLEHQRVLQDAGTEAVALPAAAAPRVFAIAPAPHLGLLSLDAEPSVRRRAVLALGRTRLKDGVPWLTAALNDPVADVRATAAFALGLVGDPAAVPALEVALSDEDALVRGRAAEGLGLIGQPAQGAAMAVAQAAAGCAPFLAAASPDDESVADPTAMSCQLALFSLVRLRQYDALARVVLDAQGAPVARWWPVAYALQRLGDRRAADALLALAPTPGVYTAAFAMRALGSWRDPRIAPIALAWAQRADADVRLRIIGVRTLGQLGDKAAAEPLRRIAFDAAAPVNLALEAMAALGALADDGAFDDLVDRFTDRRPTVRLAAMTAAAKINPETFLLLLSSLPADADAGLRAGLAGVLATLPRDAALPALESMAQDDDIRVAGAVLRALAGVDAPDLGPKLASALGAADVGVRAAAATLFGEKKLAGAVPRLAGAYERGLTDAATDARDAALGALASFGGDEALAVLRRALSDPSWPVRLHAAALLKAAGVADAEPRRPAPTREPVAVFESDAVLHPRFSPHAFIDTTEGVIELELNVVEAPLTTRSFIELARAGFFNGLRVHRLIPHFVLQTGDPRGDGAGGPGYTIADELSPLPFVRGTVGMALSRRDDGGSQFFVTLSPQPHLDGQYSVFARVVAGWDVLDRVSQGDVVERIRIWDGVSFK